MTATQAERAVLEASRAVFKASDMRDRVERLSTLKQAVDALELEALAGAVGKPALHLRFLDALSCVPGTAGTRAWNVYKRNWQSPELLAATEEWDVLSVNGAGPAVLTAWAAGLKFIGLEVCWPGAGVSPEGLYTYLEAMRRGNP